MEKRHIYNAQLKLTVIKFAEELNMLRFYLRQGLTNLRCLNLSEIMI